ncbi:MAG: rRNA maturation RNase YbeY [Bacteroidota bacterium]|nr:rRNA maturation RNase YbeY [Bacteroidota bacterium]
MGAVSLSITVGNTTDLPDESRITSIAESVFSGEERAFESLSVVLADHETVLALNREWLDHDWHTDVISFLLEEDPIDGEVYVDVETAAERHAEFDTTLTQEVERYVIHGILHLCGYDDATDEERAHMRSLEDHYLAALN